MSTFRIKIIQINIYKGRYLDELIRFLTEEDPDFITMQEVSVGSMNLSAGFDGNLFEVLRDKLSMEGVFHFDLKCNDGAGMGNAVFGKHKIVKSNVLALRACGVYDRQQLDKMTNFETFPRHLINAVFSYKGLDIKIASWHGAWVAPPKDTPETLRQSQKVADYIDQIEGPFIVGGDLNAIGSSETVGQINKVSCNLMQGMDKENTTHPKLHKIAPQGYLVDYIFCSNHFSKVSVKIPIVDVSDHLPVVAEVDLNL